MDSVIYCCVLIAAIYFALMYKTTTKMKVTNHKRLQYYEHHYGMVCLTGFLGCRWHRYQQSQDSSSKCDVGWYVMMLITSLFTFFWFYYWLLAENSWNNLNWYVYDNTGSWRNFYGMLFVATCTTLAYVALINILALCHIGHGHQVHIHWTHKVLLSLILAMCIAMVIIISDVWSHGWLLQREALMITGPFLHLGAVIVMTAVSWLIAAHWIGMYKLGPRVVYLGVYIAVMMFLYLIPIMIESPCITDHSDRLRRPDMLGHRGMAAIRPENTRYAFQSAQGIVITLESDVIVSFDGVPFLMHDDSLRRTTNVKDLYPELADRDACWFNMSQLSTLDAGSWYIQSDPFGKLKTLTDTERNNCVNQTIPTLTWLLQQADSTGQNVMFDIKGMDRCEGHPFHDTFEEVVLQTIFKSGIDPKKLWYIRGEESPHPLAQNLTQVFGENLVENPLRPDHLLELNIEIVNAEFGSIPMDTIREYQNEDLKVNIYIVDSAWLYSLYWCMEVDSITSNQAKYLSTLTKPVWLLSNKEFRAMWITADVVSAAIIILMFIIHHLRKTGRKLSKTINSERLSLQGARIRMSHLSRNRNMKEKLLHTVESLPEMDTGILGISTEELPQASVSGVLVTPPRQSRGKRIPGSGSHTPQGSMSGSQTPQRSLSGSNTPQRSNSRASVAPLENGDAGHPAGSNRFSAVSGWSEMSGISAISGTEVCDSSFGSSVPGDVAFTIGSNTTTARPAAPPSDQEDSRKSGDFTDATLEAV